MIIILTNTVAWTSAEWNVSVWMTSNAVLREETVRIKIFRIRENFRIMMDVIDVNENYSTSRKFIIIP
jgi:hypothetical protein